MKKGILLIGICLLGALVVSGCSVKKVNPLAKESAAPKADSKVSGEQGQKEDPAKEEKADIDKVVVQMVNETRGGFFSKAIATGEAVYEQGMKSEKFLSTLAVAYGYKNQLEGLTDNETKNYLRVVRKLLENDPTNRSKKLGLAGVLIETGNLSEGNRLAQELYSTAGEVKPKEVMDIYGWGLYKAGKPAEALPIYQALNQRGTDTLSQTYHAAAVIETADKAQAVNLYKRIIGWANNALTWEENRDNMASTALINKIKKDSQDAINRIQLRGRSAY